MASVKRVEYKSGRVVYRIVICQGYDKKGNKLVKNLTYSVNQSATPKQQEREAKKYAMDMEDKLKYGYDYNAEKMSFEDFAYKWLESVKDNIAYGTYAGYKQVLESRIIPYFKGDKIAHIKTPHIEAFYRTLVDDYSAGTIKRFANVLNTTPYQYFTKHLHRYNEYSSGIDFPGSADPCCCCNGDDVPQYR